MFVHINVDISISIGVLKSHVYYITGILQLIKAGS